MHLFEVARSSLVCAAGVATHLQQVEQVLERLQFPALAFAQPLDAVALPGVRLLLTLHVLHLLAVGDHVLSWNTHSSTDEACQNIAIVEKKKEQG